MDLHPHSAPCRGRWIGIFAVLSVGGGKVCSVNQILLVCTASPKLPGNGLFTVQAPLSADCPDHNRAPFMCNSREREANNCHGINCVALTPNLPSLTPKQSLMCLEILGSSAQTRTNMNFRKDLSLCPSPVERNREALQSNDKNNTACWHLAGHGMIRRSCLCLVV